MKMSIQKPHLMVCLVPNQSDSASPAAVVEILTTQNSAVTSGTLAATGSVLNHAGCRRTLVDLLLGNAAGGWGENDGRVGFRRGTVEMVSRSSSGARARRARRRTWPGAVFGPAFLPRDEGDVARIHPCVGPDRDAGAARRRSTGSPPWAAER